MQNTAIGVWLLTAASAAIWNMSSNEYCAGSDAGMAPSLYTHVS